MMEKILPLGIKNMEYRPDIHDKSAHTAVKNSLSEHFPVKFYLVWFT